MKKVLLPLIVACCLMPAAAFATHPLTGDTAETVEPSHFEAETAVEYHTDKADGVKMSGFLIQETITGGIIHNVDAYVTVPYASVKVDPGSTESGFNDVILGVKWNFAKTETSAFAVKPFIVLPVGDEKKGLGEGKVGFGAALVASLEINKHLAVDANIELKHQGVKNGDAYNEVRGSAAGKFEVTKELKVVGEIAVSKSDAETIDVVTGDKTTEKAQAYVTAGAIYSVQKSLDVDCGVRFGLTKEATDLGVLAGLTLKF